MPIRTPPPHDGGEGWGGGLPLAAPKAGRGGRGGEVSRGKSRAFTLIELLVVVVIATVLMGGVMMGMGSLTNARLKGASTMVSAAIRSAYTRASATAKPTRVVFDIDNARIWIEEGSSKMLVNDQELSASGGADPATEAERLATAQTSRIMKGPQAPKPNFAPVKQPGFEDDNKGKTGRELGGTIRFREVHVMHQAEPAREGRAYLYIWPGGQTELAYIQLSKGVDTTGDNTMTVTVHPLTGKIRVLNGAKTVPMPGSDGEASEREDRGP